MSFTRIFIRCLDEAVTAKQVARIFWRTKIVKVCDVSIMPHYNANKCATAVVLLQHYCDDHTAHDVMDKLNRVNDKEKTGFHFRYTSHNKAWVIQPSGNNKCKCEQSLSN